MKHSTTSTTSHVPSYAAIGLLGPVATALACRTIPGIPAAVPAAAGMLLALVTYAARYNCTTAIRAAITAGFVAAGSIWASVAAAAGITALGFVVLAVGVAIGTMVMLAIPVPPTQ
jgi:hypothetical protein